MAASRFVNVSDEDISQFLEENENKNTARKTSQDVALFKTFLRERKLNDPEELYIHTLLLNATFLYFNLVAWFFFKHVICNKQIITC